MTSRRIRLCLLLIVAVCSSAPAGAQTFTRIFTGNPIVRDAVRSTAQYTGCAWADFDNDGDQDLYIVQQGLYRNDGGGVFVRSTTMPADQIRALGCSWADYDNDGDLDLYVSGGPATGSVLNRNDGNGVFTRVTTGTIGDGLANQGWGCAWGDYDNDGRVDLIVSAAFGFVGITTSNHLLHNDGGDAFTRIDTSTVSAATGPYTIPSWNDVDDDGDLDLFIAAGPANGTLAPDFLYENRGSGAGESFFQRFTTGALATESNDGQLYNWIDIDGDGDLDCYLTNYGGTAGVPNNLYRNDGGVFVKLAAAQAGPIVSDAQLSLASVWGDFDNDGDLDCVVTNDGGVIPIYYTNDGNGFFTADVTSALRTPGTHFGGATADYDGDGDLDVYLHGNASSRALFRNDSPATNGWLNVRCVGSVSNHAAIGAKIWVRATIGGNSKRLVQLVSAQNSFNGHNPLEQHFGTGEAVTIDSVIVRFPSGVVRTLTGVSPRQTVTVVEDATTAVRVSVVLAEAQPGGARLVWQLGSAEGATATVYRRTETSGWEPMGRADIEASGRVEFVDRNIVTGTRYAYELGLGTAQGEQRLGIVWLAVPGPTSYRLEWLGSNPVRGPLRFALTSPSGGDATLALVDVTGREVYRSEHIQVTAGRQVFEVLPANALQPGIYWARATHASAERTVRIVIVR